MAKKTAQIIYEEHDDESTLSPEEAALLHAAREATKQAYAPYSRFRVGAMLLMENGEMISGTNQENASFPVGICAERVGLSAASSRYPGMPVKAIAVSYDNELGASDRPITPCGICRQTLAEYQQRFSAPIRLILAGLTGKIWVIPDSEALLPLSFSAEDMQ